VSLGVNQLGMATLVPLDRTPRTDAPSIRTIEAERQQSIKVEEFRGTAAEWDGYVRRSVNGTFCHLLGWREIIADVLGHECHYLVARDDSGECQGVLPLARVRSRLFGDYLLSMPFLNYGGPIGTPEAEEQLCRHARHLAQAFEVKLLELRTRHRARSELQTADRKVTVLLPLPASADALMARFPAKLRSQIRRPMKEGMEVRVGADQRDAFYAVFARNMRDLGTPVLPRRLFDEIARVFAREVVFCAVYYQGQPVAAGCGLIWGQEFELTWASSLREHNQRAPNMLLYWGLMQHMIGRGLGVFNFGRCTPDGGTHRFKLQWGGETVPLSWLQWSSTGTAAPPSPDRPLFQMATRIWSRMPLAMANTIGPLLARNLP
jgi:FemAB-related protein (PEP-CTERM system-associated)